MKTRSELIEEIEASKSEYVVYGDMITPVKKEDAIEDIECMDEELIGDGDWTECDAQGKFIE